MSTIPSWYNNKQQSTSRNSNPIDRCFDEYEDTKLVAGATTIYIAQQQSDRSSSPINQQWTYRIDQQWTYRICWPIDQTQQLQKQQHIHNNQHCTTAIGLISMDAIKSSIERVRNCLPLSADSRLLNNSAIYNNGKSFIAWNADNINNNNFVGCTRN